MTERLHYIDVAKGILILLVVLLHVSYMAKLLEVDNALFRLMLKWSAVYTMFFMPAFFVITGMCSNFVRPFVEFMWRNVKTILVPVVVIMTAYNALMGIDVFDGLLKSFGRWFLFALFISKALYWLLCRTLPQMHRRLIAGLLLSIMACAAKQYLPDSNIFYWQHALALTVFLAVGEAIRAVDFSRRGYLLPLMGGCLWAFSFVVSIVCVKDIPIITDMNNIGFKTLLLHWLGATAGTVTVLGLARAIGRSRFLEFAGRETLTIYITHFFFITVMESHMRSLIHNNPSQLQSLGWFVLIYVVALAGSLLVARLLDVKPLRWLKGKW